MLRPVRKCAWFVLVVQFGFLFGDATLVSLAQTTPPAIRSESTVVLLPALVKTKSGRLVFGLSARDFIVEDDGVQQSVQLDDSPEGDPISVVIAVQLGRTAALQLEKPQPPRLGDDGSSRGSGAPLSGLGTMLESYVGEGRAEVAVVTFDSQVLLLQDFTEEISSVADRLRKLSPGDDGAAILDAVLYSNRLLDRHPAGGASRHYSHQRIPRPRESRSEAGGCGAPAKCEQYARVQPLVFTGACRVHA